MAYLITGVGGNAGHYVAAEFLSAGYDVIGIDIKTSSAQKAASYLSQLAKKKIEDLLFVG
ncbi:MAG: NAD-dependent epimerase/dehydratase family protein [Gammaproteobacteria bacterium]|nr:NAD-dependent epimerase/dehydratase family protein [Gammaproteobacteria bacterium]